MVSIGSIEGSRRKAIAVSALLLTAGLTLFSIPPSAQAELVERGDLFVKFSGGITPTTLPRDRRAPIGIEMSGAVKTLSGSRPPALRHISMALNRSGRLETRGLPICRPAQIDPATSAVALARCRPALVGGGSYVGNTAFPEQATFPARGRILAFNSVQSGQPTILAHIYGPDPVPTTRLIVFHIRHGSGLYDTTLSGDLPAATNRYGYVRKISLRFFRLFTYRGRVRSYLSAACAAPSGFPGTVFSFARASMAFADGSTLSSSLTRSCRVRRP
jgi:hypothetical protein